MALKLLIGKAQKSAIEKFDDFQHKLNDYSRLLINRFEKSKQLDMKFSGQLESPTESVDFDEIAKICKRYGLTTFP